ncbi:type II toxin-antitoxin system Phd/YefM family antitoxin [Coraliomargarita parva]|uniref:type II toxin-antitoxin system Phd/YefM family antitoxin n=1 Tax=Coraliomargarita parva TaxID=3014050 RepID=UPI0022B49C83|nr:hypothetical protein [Coraliomargarita parva]
MLKVNIHEAKTQLSRYAKRVKAGETILLCERNVPFAELRPLRQADSGARERPLGLDAGKVTLTEGWDSAETNAAITDLFDRE